MPTAHHDLYKRYLWATMSQDPDAVAESFTPDGVFEAPLVLPGQAFPARMEGREQIRDHLAAYYRRSAASGSDRQVDVANSRYELHATADPDVFIVEIDTAFTSPTGPTTMSLVQVFRLRDGKIALLRDYFAPDSVV
ncbi:nuclear transport factor 2 family protein [Allokutzneria sp. A3M-2-11 16]|uniref:nuclear transport factor 2 family protein n=1 Tax=Allokutzneria sp. A3M-2-11 16 TaxID=2962043 RepID=UPI0020B88E84|nr:nuclear transport factor 2 family protein [Allokutzneria sp. A3M-2-11 16]MCP3805357.1 nuclear transport factor 2 family protein [Allokutzneria sp. A3M-2-11 16]